MFRRHGERGRSRNRSFLGLRLPILAGGPMAWTLECQKPVSQFKTPKSRR